MVKQQLIDNLSKKGFDSKIIKAFKNVERKDFVPDSYKHFAYRDRPLPIGENATISQPFTIAFMISLLEVEGCQKILEIGSGSGYVLALLREISPKSDIIGLEINADLAEKSNNQLESYENISVLNIDGSNGYPQEKPYDRIIVSAAFSKEPIHLIDQLGVKGILVSPVSNSIIKYTKSDNNFVREEHFGFSFVPII